MKLLKYISIVLLVTLISCEKIELETADNNVPVVESYIHPGENIIITIKKQLIFNSEDTSSQYLDDLDLILSDGTNTYSIENTSEGNYEDSTIQILENTEYTLEFLYNNKIVTAVTQTPSKPTGFTTSESTIEVISMDNFTPGSGSFPERPDPVTLSYDNPDNEYHMIVVECTETDPTLINSDTDRPTRSFRNTPIQGTSQELDPMQLSYYGTHRLILYRLNPEYAALYEQMETNSIDIEAPPSNVENGLGIFTGINSDTLYINVVSQ